MVQYIERMAARLKNSWQYRDLLKQLVIRDIKLKYRRSFLGYLWSVLNPLLIMLVMTIVFSTMFSRNIENFPVYLFTGQVLFNFMNTSTHQAIFSITGNSALLKKTYVPKYIFTVSKITSGLVDFLFSLGALVIVMLATHAPFTKYILLFPFVAIQLYLFCVGLGMFLAQANVFFRDIQYIYNAVTTAWMYLTPIFYPVEALPSEVLWFVKHFNPMYFYVGQFRDLVYYGRMPGHVIILAGCTTSVVMLIIGVWSFMKSQDKFILYI
ncbi:MULTISPECIES: ABC transporter permease [Clostridia]|uniref:ABC transporter permease n=1 Tax=Clostridia TaxID=186801 RepID=UPI0005D32BE5|nr:MULTISPECIES: ABC transporter permease [Clostridia]KJJ65598.1 teichoic acid translocation permease protein TagG [Clostridium sp. FS41]MCC8085767.1 ABC transporter permease [Clostridium sp.]SFS23119.1 lipopolysaccharide transport system permease protein [Enterocloster citroniae]